MELETLPPSLIVPPVEPVAAAPAHDFLTVDFTGTRRGECGADGCSCDQYRYFTEARKDYRCALCGHYPLQHTKISPIATPAAMALESGNAISHQSSEDPEATKGGHKDLIRSKLWHKQIHAKQGGLAASIIPVALRSTWRQRWFVLDPKKPQIRYYSWNMKALGAIDLRLANKVVSATEPPMYGRFVFSIEADTGVGSYTLAAETAEERNLWVDKLGQVFDTMPQPNTQLLDSFRNTDQDKNWTLDFGEVRKLLRDMNVQVLDEDMRLRFEMVDTDHSDNLDYTEFEHLVSNLRHNEQMSRLFKDCVTDDATHMPVEVLYKFLRTVQQDEQVTVEKCMRIIANHRPDDAQQLGAATALLDQAGWTKFLSSPIENGPFRERECSKIYQDMTRPLSHYFIASSNNTYVEGGFGVSNMAIKRALETGCRNIELDIYDGPGNPVITRQGITLQKFKLTEALQEIKESAFKVTMLPLIVSIDMYCTEQQDLVAKHFQDILGDMLAPVFRRSSSDFLPSPCELLHKIIIIGKVRYDDAHEKQLRSFVSIAIRQPQAMRVVQRDDPPLTLLTHPIPELDLAFQQQKLLPPEFQIREDAQGLPGMPLGRQETLSVIRPQFQLDDEDDANEVIAGGSLGGKSAVAKKKIKLPISKSISAITHLSNINPKDLSAVELERIKLKPCWVISSFVDADLDKIAQKKDAALALLRYNSSHLTRVYPRSKLMSGANFDPVASWCCGCQLVALNYQTSTSPMWINAAKFQDNGGCGYVLKPEWMIRGVDPPKNPRNLLVRVISARQLPKVSDEVIDPYIRLRLHGYGSDNFDGRTKHINNNGWDPVWLEEFIIPISVPEMAVLSLTVMDKEVLKSNDFIANCSIALPLLRNGYRAVPLYTKEKKLIDGAHLFCYFSFPHEA